MNFENRYIDELIALRQYSREKKDWKTSDEIRGYFDEKRVFIFDIKNGQEVWYLPECYFKNKHKITQTSNMSDRQYVEYRIKEDACKLGDEIVRRWNECEIKK